MDVFSLPKLIFSSLKRFSVMLLGRKSWNNGFQREKDSYIRGHRNAPFAKMPQFLAAAAEDTSTTLRSVDN